MPFLPRTILSIAVFALTSACGSAPTLTNVSSVSVGLSPAADQAPTAPKSVAAAELPKWEACLGKLAPISLDQAYKSRLQEGVYVIDVTHDAGAETFRLLNASDLESGPELYRTECAYDLAKAALAVE